MSPTLRTYDHGDLVRVYLNTENLARVPTNPGTLTAHVRQPDGTTTEGNVENEDTGRNYVDVNTLDAEPDAAAGTWTVRFQGTGVVQGAAEHTFRVRERIVPAA